MVRKILFSVLGLIVALAAYLLLWPVAIEPVAWNAPVDAGYVADYRPNERLKAVSRIALPDHTGPEDAAFGPDGALYMATHEGAILRYDPGSGAVRTFATTNGRPLGVEFGPDGTLYVADAYRGLLAISNAGAVTVLADTTDGDSPILYADDLDIAPDGSVYFSDASTRFGAEKIGSTLSASILDLMEHSSNGRVLRYDPATGKTTTVLDGLNFPNGVAMTQSGRHYLLVETGTYSVLKVAVDGSAPPQTIVENLPGFPDNINRNADGTFWFGVVSPRSKIADQVSAQPFLRKVIMRLPAFVRPKAQRYSFVVRIDEEGQVLDTLQDPEGSYALNTGLIEGPDGRRYVTSLTEPDLGVLPAE